MMLLWAFEPNSSEASYNIYKLPTFLPTHDKSSGLLKGVFRGNWIWIGILNLDAIVLIEYFFSKKHNFLIILSCSPSHPLTVKQPKGRGKSRRDEAHNTPFILCTRALCSTSVRHTSDL